MWREKEPDLEEVHYERNLSGRTGRGINVMSNEIRKEREKWLKEHIENLRPLDDEYMRCMFKDQRELAQFVLRILTGYKDLMVIDFETQKDMALIGGEKSPRFDLYAEDSQGNRYDVEVQRRDSNDLLDRARYNFSIMERESIDAGQDYDEKHKNHVIYVMEKDIYGDGKPFHRHIDIDIDQSGGRSLDEFTKTDEIGSKMFVSGEYRGDDDLGRLMHDFNCSRADDMYLKPLANRTWFLKETRERVDIMSKDFEEYIEKERKEAIQQNNTEMAEKMLLDGTLPPEKIALFTNISISEVHNLQKQIGA